MARQFGKFNGLRFQSASPTWIYCRWGWYVLLRFLPVFASLLNRAVSREKAKPYHHFKVVFLPNLGFCSLTNLGSVLPFVSLASVLIWIQIPFLDSRLPFSPFWKSVSWTLCNSLDLRSLRTISSPHNQFKQLRSMHYLAQPSNFHLCRFCCLL